MPVEVYALMLLIFRIVSVGLIVDVIRKQIELRRRSIANKEAKQLREDMYKLAITALALNIIPILVDVFTIFGITTRPNTVGIISIIYMLSYASGTLLLTGIIWRMYRKALK